MFNYFGKYFKGGKRKKLNALYKKQSRKRRTYETERTIKNIVIHHSASLTKNWEGDKTLRQWDKLHRDKFHDIWGQPTSTFTPLRHIAYHYIVAPTGKVIQGRDLDVIGYHAGNKKVNTEGIGICVVGNFEEEEIKERQYEALCNLIDNLKQTHKTARLCTHRSVKQNGYTACPGGDLVHRLRESGYLKS